MKRNASLYLLISLILIGLMVWSGCGPSGREETITIGAVAPMTGKYAEMGNDLLNAVRMAVEEKNEQGGIRGKKVVLLVEDDKASPKDAVTVAHKLVGDKSVVGVVGHLNSGTTLPASSVYSQGDVPLIMPVPTNPDITKHGFTNLFRVPITDDRQGPACADFMLDKLNKANIVIIHNKQAYGEGIATEFRKEIEARGKIPLFFEGINADDQDFRPVITRVKGFEPDGIFFGGGYAEVALFIKQSRELGLDIPFVMGDGCFDTQLMKIAGGAAEGCVVSNIAPITAPTERAKEFYQKFEQRHQKIVAFAPLGYIATNILMDAIEKADAITREGVLTVLQNSSYAYDSILGTFAFEENGDSKGQKVFFHVIKDGRFEAY